MDNLPKGLQLDPDTFGIVVNDKPEPSAAAAVEQQIAEVEAPFKVMVKLTANELVRFDRVITDANTTRDEFVAKLIRERIETISKPSISTPSVVKGGRVTGPTYSVRREG